VGALSSAIECVYSCRCESTVNVVKLKIVECVTDCSSCWPWRGEVRVWCLCLCAHWETSLFSQRLSSHSVFRAECLRRSTSQTSEVRRQVTIILGID